MDLLLDWFHDDITWCGSECDNTECFRHLSNRRNKEGYFTMSYLKDTELCPLMNNDENNKEKK